MAKKTGNEKSNFNDMLEVVRVISDEGHAAEVNAQPGQVRGAYITIGDVELQLFDNGTWQTSKAR